MSLTTEQLLLLWAKSPRGKTDKTLYHPLLCHLIDVAMVARAMWEEVLTPAFRIGLAEGLGFPEDAAGVWISFLAGLHDIGKASPGFQSKWPDGRRVMTALNLRWPPYPEDRGHGLVSALALFRSLTGTYRIRNEIARDLSLAIGGHHGNLFLWQQVEDAGAKAVAGDPSWEHARGALLTILGQLLGVDGERVPSTAERPALLALAGMVSVADWIGSDEDYFPYVYADTVSDVPGYADERKGRAHAALEALGWLGWTHATAPVQIGDLFPFIQEPRPVQQRVSDLAERDDGPSIFVIEVPMGEGKTEAALYLADRWGVSLGQRGCYVAMPTMSTSNQMFSRVRSYLEKRYPTGLIHLQLLHSQAAIAPELEALRSPPEETSLIPIETDETPRNRAMVAAWFTTRKRGLLAPFGVGTVDQSLLSALRVRHGFVRLFGLTGKTVIFDEVHAYDTYMSTLHEHVLGWLGALGTSVVVLTATLPVVRRDAIIQAWARGAGVTIGELPPVPYPRVTWATSDGSDAETIAISPLSQRMLQLEYIHGNLSADTDGVPEIEYLLSSALNCGGCAVVVCNTVRRAQQVYTALRSSFPGIADDGLPELMLFHARFPWEERDRREKQVLCRFGKPGDTVSDENGDRQPVQRPYRTVLVATQVVEQSLDLDFDLMISDLAPVDLLLQRSGRLHRHERGARPCGLEQPVLRVCRPQVNSSGQPAFDPGDEGVYSAYPLLQSWLVLRNRTSIRIPEDVGQLVDASYADTPPLTGDLELDTYVQEVKAKFDDEREQRKKTAQLRVVPDPWDDAFLSEFSRNALAEDSPELHDAFRALTRLGPPSVSIVCLYETTAGPALDPEGQVLATLGTSPRLPDARALLRRAITIAHRGVYYELIKPDVPTPWSDSALLSEHRMLTFDAAGEATRPFGGYRLRLDADLGLVIERVRKEEA